MAFTFSPEKGSCITVQDFDVNFGGSGTAVCLKIFPKNKTKMTAAKLGWVGGICYNWNLFHVRMLFSGESELAHRLRTELDLADKLDKNLINQLAFVTQPSNDQPIEIWQESTSPEKEAEISSRLQVSWLLFR